MTLYFNTLAIRIPATAKGSFHTVLNLATKHVGELHPTSTDFTKVCEDGTAMHILPARRINGFYTIAVHVTGYEINKVHDLSNALAASCTAYVTGGQVFQSRTVPVIHTMYESVPSRKDMNELMQHVGNRFAFQATRKDLALFMLAQKTHNSYRINKAAKFGEVMKANNLGLYMTRKITEHEQMEWEPNKDINMPSEFRMATECAVKYLLNFTPRNRENLLAIRNVANRAARVNVALDNLAMSNASSEGIMTAMIEVDFRKAHMDAESILEYAMNYMFNALNVRITMLDSDSNETLLDTDYYIL